MRLESEGQNIPVLHEMPELDFWELRYWSAFAYLSNRRQAGMGLSPISYQDILLYLDEECIHDFEVKDAYKHWISFLDNEYLKSKSEEQKNKRKKVPPKTNK